MSWSVTNLQKQMPKLKNPILIEGLPGIGNVGKVAIDYIIEALKAKPAFDLFSNTFPHSVFVNEDNIVELPNISVYHAKVGTRDFLFLAGDIQPTEETASYDFCHAVLELMQEHKGKEIITLGGIALPKVPREPKVYLTGNDTKMIERFSKGTKVQSKLYGVVGPIVGVSGLLLGLAKRREIPAVTLLAETLGHPMYLGMEGAREIIRILNKKYRLGIDIKGFDAEIKAMEAELMKKSKDMDDVQKSAALQKIKGKIVNDMNYIG